MCACAPARRPAAPSAWRRGSRRTRPLCLRARVCVQRRRGEACMSASREPLQGPRPRGTPRPRVALLCRQRCPHAAALAHAPTAPTSHSSVATRIVTSVCIRVRQPREGGGGRAPRRCVTVRHATPQCATMRHNAPRCATMRHNAPQCATTHHDTPRRSADPLALDHRPHMKTTPWDDRGCRRFTRSNTSTACHTAGTVPPTLDRICRPRCRRRAS